MLKKFLIKLNVLLICISVISSCCVFADGETVLATYKSGFDSVQGKDNWYYCFFSGDEVNELIWDGSKYIASTGETYPKASSADFIPSNDEGVGYKFVSPQKGMIRVKGEVAQAYADSTKGNGIVAHIKKKSKEYWSATVTYGNIQKYDLTIPIKAGEELYFYADANGNNGYDWFWWRPIVEYIDVEYTPEEEDALYFQKRDGNLLRLKFDEDAEKYVASDGIAYISSSEVRPSENYTLVKRYVVPESTRYRVQGTLTPSDDRNGGTILTIKKDDEVVWNQIFLGSSAGKFDVRMRAEAGQNIDVELSVAEFSGYNAAEWSCSIDKIPGTAACNATTSDGHTYAVLDEFSLSSLAGKTTDSEVKFYSQRFSRKVPMSYNSSTKKWQSTVEGDTGYFSASAAYPGKHYDSVMEYTLKKDGILRIDGSLAPEGASDGVLSKIFINDKEVWSSRIGGERVVRWDEPYDTSYFSYDVSVTANVKAGDIIKFSFNQWRLTKNDTVDLSNVMLKYISGEILSETTKWKLDNSIVIDTLQKTVRKDGKTENVDVFVSDGSTYIAINDAMRILGADFANETDVLNDEYVKLRNAAEKNGKSVAWAADRIVLIHDGIPVLFTWAENSEIAAALEGGDLFD